MTGLTSKMQMQTLSNVFSECAVDVLNAFFNQKFEIKMPWEVVDQLQCQFDIVLTLGASSCSYRAICCAGIQFDSFKAFTGIEQFSEKYACDILGEFCNCFHGALCRRAEFVQHFGELEQAVPTLYTEGHSYLPFISGVQGYVYLGRHWIYIGYSICKSLPKNDSIPNL